MPPRKASAGGTKKAAGTKSPRGRKTKGAEAGSRGLTPAEAAASDAPASVAALAASIRSDGGSVLGTYRDPLGGHWQILASLPVERVEPTPFQRDLSDAHVARLTDVIDRLDRFLDPVITVRRASGTDWTPNGHHRTAAVKRLGGRSITALVLPDEEVAYRILALNTEKAHNLREKSLEVIRMARSLAALDARKEPAFVLEFEDPAFLTLGCCYEKKPRFSGSAYHPVLKRIDGWIDEPLSAALETRGERAASLLELEEAVAKAIEALRAKGFESPYLRAFVVSRINPLRFQRGAKAEFDATIAKMLDAARKFDAGKVKSDQVARASGPPDAD